MRADFRSMLLAAIFCVGAPFTALHATPPLSAYGELPGFERAAISPNGDKVAMIVSNAEIRALLITENGKTIRRINLGDIKVRFIEWASDDIVLLEYSKTEKLVGFVQDKAEFNQTFVISLNNVQPKILFEKQKEIIDATFGWFGIRDVDGKIYGYVAGVPLVKMQALNSNVPAYVYEGGTPALYRVDMADMSAKMLATRPQEGEWNDFLIDAKGVIGAKLNFAYKSGVWKITNGLGQQVASGVNIKGGVGLQAFGKDGSSIIYSRDDDDTDARHYFEVPAKGGDVTEIFADANVARLFTHRRTGALLGYFERGDEQKTHLLDPIQDRKLGKIALAFPKLRRNIADWNPTLSKILVTTSGNQDSGTWWTVDLNAMAANHLGFERPPIDSSDVGAISTVVYEASDGLEMDGILTLPVGKEPKKLPVIILPHGGPTAHDDASFDWWAQGLASRGYAVFQPNFRGSTNRGAAFVKAGHGEWGRKMQSDLSDGLAHLAAQGIVDPKRACIVGASYGGYAALAGVTLQKGLYRCAVSVAGVSDLSLMVSTDLEESGQNPLLKRNLDAEIGRGRDLKDVSPRRFAADADAPIMLIHGKDDVVVPYRQSAIMADALKDAGKPYELVSLVGEDHWLSKSVTRQQMLEALVAFVEKHNPPQ